MRAQQLIPFQKEFKFIATFILLFVFFSVLAFFVIYLFFNQNLGAAYGPAFQKLNQTYEAMNGHVLVAAMVQLALPFGFTFLLSLYFSHKIAGPMFRLSQTLKNKGNAEHVHVQFRHSDFLAGVQDEFNELFDYLAERREKIETLQEFVEGLDYEDLSGEQLQAIRGKLEEVT